jgi:hypothetical protein
MRPKLRFELKRASIRCFSCGLCAHTLAGTLVDSTPAVDRTYISFAKQHNFELTRHPHGALAARWIPQGLARTNASSLHLLMTDPPCLFFGKGIRTADNMKTWFPNATQEQIAVLTVEFEAEIVNSGRHYSRMNPG